jgi:hypothetical protein
VLTLTSKNVEETTRDRAMPFYVVELVMSTVTYRWSTGREAVWNGQTFVESGVNVEGKLEPQAGGGKIGQISLPNADKAGSALVLGENMNFRPIRIWKLYGAGPYDVEDAVPQFDGVCDGVPDIGDTRVFINLFTNGKHNNESPPLVYDLFTVPPPAGTVVSWQGEHFTLESRT